MAFLGSKKAKMLDATVRASGTCMRNWVKPLLCSVTLLTFLSLSCQGRAKPYAASEFVGTWLGIYADRSGGPIVTSSSEVTSVETITFRADGT